MKEILDKCKCGVFLTVNEHRDYYDSAEKYIEEDLSEEKISDEIKEGMIKRNIIMSLQFYPITPIGFYKIYHYDYDELIKIAKDTLNEINMER